MSDITKVVSYRNQVDFTIRIIKYINLN